jgi:hypothetical protein
MKKLKQKIKNIGTGIMNIYLIILWIILFPFIFIFDRLFGGWKNEKEKNDTRTS